MKLNVATDSLGWRILTFFLHFGKSEVNDVFGFRVGWERLVANLGILCGESV